MSSIVIAGDTSGSVTLQAPAVSGSTVLNLPATSGTIQASGAGYTTNGVAYATSATGLVTGSTLSYNGTRLLIGGVSAGTVALSIPAGDITSDVSSGSFAVGNYGDTSSALRLSTRGFTTFRTGATDGTNGTERARITSGGDMEFKNSGGTSVSFIGVSSTAAQFGNRQNDAMILYTNNTELARIDSSGRILVNGTQSTTNTFLQVNTNGGNGASGYMAVMANGGSVANQTAGIYLARTNNSIISNVDGSGNFRDNIIVQAGGSGGVVLTTTATAWASNSDIRKKIIIEPISNALSGILSWRTIIGRYKTDNEQRRRLFLIAQDVLATNPEAVVVQDEGQESEDLLLGYSDTIPVLVAAIKEQQALITQLTERITALEAN